ncbi:hypothetical protein CER19_16680 [Pseudomonas sp. GL93]|uniref:hypothetical protein n=1 Tax=Pseudomonas sp. GL93 TaxID=2014741 RepID=UPI000E30D018|nr:hypothetical protein [Pseudomonas sp. GL93]RFD27913.1 hypothetical protein CER19_16680 [Pseudomonas sp. GL93]
MVTQASKCRLSKFSISRPANTQAANGLYANGRHQCEVLIDVVKEISGVGDEWVRVRLTDQERASVTVVECSEHGNQTLTPGWSCDVEKNQFTLGLWQDKSLPHEPVNDLEERLERSLEEPVKRYLRCSPDAPIGPAVFMACVTIDSCVYTTYSFKHDAVFESFITINPVRPMSWDADDMDLYVDYLAYFSAPPYRTLVDVYYWTPPGGLWVVKNMGFDSPLGLPGEGEDFQSVLSWHSPIDNTASSRVGTFINKDELDSTLHLHEIDAGLPAPSPDPFIPFNKRATVLRAIRLKSPLVPENRDAKSFWRVLDNYGTEQKFLVKQIDSMNLPGVPFFKLTGEIVRTLRVIHFKITLPGGGTFTDELYANGRHQCKVVAEVTVEQLDSDGYWVPARLSNAERNSLTISLYSPNFNEPLPEGWSCDKEKNIYDTGLWRTRIDEVRPDQKPEAVAGHAQRQVEIVERYLRVDPSVPVEERRFMASIELGGVTYTTNYSDGDVAFDSYVVVRPARLYQLHVRDLTRYADHDAYHDEYYDVDVYYWTPPAGLHFLVNKGLDSPLSVSKEGLNFQTSYFNKGGEGYYFKGGAVINKDVAGPVVSLDDIVLGTSSGHEKIVRFNMRPTIMRAVVARVRASSSGSDDAKSKWRILDNYGCEHVFSLQQIREGLELELVDG